MEFGQLKHFLAVIDTGSVGDAARKLGMSQGALSNSIRALEKSVSASLFERSSRGMRLTPAGETLEGRARIINAEARFAGEELELLSKGLKGRVSFAIGSSTAHAILPRVIEQFSRAHPRVQLSIAEGYFGNFVTRLEAGDVDFGVFTLASGNFPSLTTEPLIKRNRVVILTSAQNPRVFPRKVTLKDLWTGPWILNRDHPGLRDDFTRAFRRAGLPPPLPTIEITAGTLPLQVALSNPSFYFITPELFVREDVKAGRLKVVPLHVTGLERELCAYYRKRSTLSPIARNFLNTLRQIAAEVSGRPRR
jgi:LysR family transcriptional regulator of gallate degradation